MTEEQTPTSQPRSIADLRPKMRLEGTVRRTELHGAVVDIGLEQDGLVHISQLAPARINRVSDVVKAGDSVTVWVTKVSPEAGRIALTMVQPPEVDWNELAEGQIRNGVVTRLEPYGAFVDIGAERAGLLHVREMSSGYIRNPSELVKIGDEVAVRIIQFDRRKRRIDLSMIGVDVEEEEPEPDEDEAPRTAMEMAMNRARTQGSVDVRRPVKPVRPDMADQHAILAQTLERHANTKR